MNEITKANLSRLKELKGNRPFSRLGKTFQTDHNKYFYDTGTGKVLQCTDIVFDILRCLEKSDSFEALNDLKMTLADFDTALTDIIDAVENEKILQAPIFLSFSGAHVDAVEKYVNEGLEHITLEVTERCNLRCDYCIYQESNDLFRGYGTNDMNFEVAKKAIDYAAKHSGRELSITFYGGEPLLKFDLIKECIEYSINNLKDKELTFAMTTNAVLLSKEIAEYIASVKKFIITISIDGDKRIHNEHRKFENGEGSFDKALQGLKNLVDALNGQRIEERLTFSMVLCPPYSEEKFTEIQHFFESLEWLPQNISKNVSYVQYARQDIPDKSDLEYERVDPLGVWTLGQIYKNRKLRYNNTFNIKDFEKSLLRIHNRRLCQSPMESIPFNACCIPGSRRLYVTYEGRFKVCEKIGLSPYIGDVDNCADIKSIKKNYIYSYMEESIKYCQNCWAVHLCNVCYAECYNEDGILMQGKFALCESTRYVQTKALENYHRIMEISPEELIYLNNLKIK